MWTVSAQREYPPRAAPAAANRLRGQNRGGAARWRDPSLGWHGWWDKPLNSRVSMPANDTASSVACGLSITHVCGTDHSVMLVV